MTNICRCGTYQRIRAAVHMAAGMKVAAGGQRAEGHESGRWLMKTTTTRRRRTCRAAGSSSARPPWRAVGSRWVLPLPFGIDVAAGPAEAATLATGTPEVNAWVVVMPDDRCVIRIARSEMGQGTMTGLAQLVAEELECDWAKVSTEFPTPGESLARKRTWGEMGTGGSRGIRTSQDYVRKGGAAARMMLMQAAADEWKVPVAELTVSNGVITHAPRSARRRTARLRRGGQASRARSRDDQTQGPEGLEDRRQAGEAARHRDQAQRRARLRDRRQAAGHALRGPQGLPGLRWQARELRRDEDRRPARIARAVRVDESTVAVVADTWWRARTALEALPVVWDEGPGASQSSATIAAHLKEGLTAPVAYGMRQEGDALKAIAGAAKKVEAVYSTPFLAHATMEPMNCTARITPERAEVWVATQNGEASLAALSEASGLPLEKCEVYKHILGGGFGRRGGAQDYVRQAVAIAKQFPGVPIKMIWSREEDMTHDFYRPISQCRAAAGLDEKGKLVGLHVRVSGPVDQRVPQPGGGEGRPRRPPVAGLLRRSRRRAAGLHRAEPPRRIRDAQHARAGRPVAGGQHQPERRVHGVLHRRGGASGRHRPGGVPPCADAIHPKHLAVLNAVAPRPTGASRCRRACIAVSRSSWATAAIPRRSPRFR
jgi:isoquinoline 1-oxidoreductase beta subunit